MNLKFFVPEIIVILRATVHKSGKIGFTDATAKALGLNTQVGMSVGTNQDDATDKTLYVVLYSDYTMDPSCFKVSKAGQYYYLNTHRLVSHLKIPLGTGYVITKAKINNLDVWKFKPTTVRKINKRDGIK